MTIPFLNFFKRGAKVAEQTEAPRRSPVEKPSGERLSKTVMPNTARIAAREDIFQMDTDVAPMPSEAPPQNESRMISYTPNSIGPKAKPRDLPPAVALALEPEVERVVSLQLVDIIGQVPAGYLKPTESFDVTRKVLLKASELEKGMSTGKPSVSLSHIHEQVPEIFLRKVPRSDKAEVALPFEKVLEGFQKVKVRRDQVQEAAVPQVQTPFLQATLEDNELFGMPVEPPQPGELPPVPVRVEPATAESIAAATPEASSSERFIATIIPPPGIPLHGPSRSKSPQNGNPAESSKDAEQATIPFDLPPKGMGAPAAERVPASSGPPVPKGAQSGPTRIPFKVSPPSEDLRRQHKFETAHDWPAANGDLHAVSGVSGQQGATRTIRLGLKLVLQGLPAFQVSGNPNEVDDDAAIELPFSLIEPQLATGRVAVLPKIFEEALPDKYLRYFNGSEPHTPVSLPLEEVLKNLPKASLPLRGDQEEQEIGGNFQTVFSDKAAEDAMRLNVDPNPIAKPVAGIATAPDEKLDAKTVVAAAMQLSGVLACAVTFADGLSLAGNLPEGIGADGLCAMAPSLLQRIENYVVDTKLGQLDAMTLHCSKSPVTFFMHGNICLAALHSAEELARDIREQLGRMTQELSRMYSKPEVSHVHH